MIEKLVKKSKNLKVLYVEDDEETRIFTLHMLEEFFNKVVVAVDGLEGLRKYELEHFDLVIADITMPNMDGVVMSREILEIDKNQSIIIMSAYSESPMLMELMNMGVEYFIQKPIDLKQVVDIFSQCVTKNLEKRDFLENVKKIEDLNKELDSLIGSYDKYVIASRTDPKGNITYVSEAFCKIAGYKESELIGKPHNMVRHPDMPKEVFKELWESIKSGNIWQGEVKNIRRDGTHYWVKAAVGPYYDQSSGELLGYSAIREDITFQKEVLELGLKLKAQSKQMSDLLNNAGEGFLSFDENLIVEQTLSREALKLLGDEVAGKNIATVLYATDDKKRELFKDIIGNILAINDDLSKEMMLSLLEKELSLGDKTLELEYKFLGENRFMLVISDITEKKFLQREIEYEKKTQKMIVSIVSNYDEFFELINDYESFVSTIDCYLDNNTLVELKREIHTFKGLFAQKEMFNTVNGLHNIETQMNVCIESSLNKHLFEGWLACDMRIIKKVLGDDFLANRDKISISCDTLAQIEEKITIISEHYKGEELDLLLGQIQSLRDKPLKELLSNYPDMAQKIANKLEKSIYAFEIKGDKNLKVSQKYKPFLKSLVHVFRNSIDHGIEELDLRVQDGKDEIGSIKCQFSHLDDQLILEISDDGKGIDVDVLKEKAISSGKLCPKVAEKLTHKEQLELIFVDSISTKDNVNELSGRGIGLGAVKAEIEKLGGVLEIESKKGIGTTFTFKTKLEELGVENANV